MSTGTLTSCRQALLRHFGMLKGTFWHVDEHTYYFTLYYPSVPTYSLALRGVVLACGRAHLRRFWHGHGHICVVLACRWAHFGTSTGTLTILHYTLLFSPYLLFGIAGVPLACRRAHLLPYSLLVSPSNLLFGIAGRRFGMSTGTLLFTILPFQPTFWHRRASFCHVDGHIYVVFSMSTGTLTSFWHIDLHAFYFTFYCSPFPTYFLVSRGVFLAVDRQLYHFTLYCSSFPSFFLASGGVVLACRWGHLLCHSLLSPVPTYFLAS